MTSGDLYGGLYCGENRTGDNMLNCEIGYYCPTPEEKYICPEGYFCPHKSTTFDLYVCDYCKEGAVKFVPDLYGFVVLGIVVAALVLYILWKLFKRYFNVKAIDRLHNFQSSFLANHFSEFEHRMVDLKNKVSTKKASPSGGPGGGIEDLEKLRPKLELINRRVEELRKEQEAEARGDARPPLSDSQKESQKGNGSSGRDVKSGGDSKVGKALGKLSGVGSAIKGGASAGKSTTSGAGKSTKGSTISVTQNISNTSIHDDRKPIEFDARAVFDILDADDSGDVTFEELNAILGFNDLELGEFVRRMNELGGQSKDLQSVTRPIFVKYFLQVLKDTTNLTVSFEEAAELFEEMSNGKDQVHMSKFYTSSMSDFLSDIQILDLIKVRFYDSILLIRCIVIIFY